MTVAMTAFDNLTHELEGKFGVGSAAQPLMRELLELMSARGGGVAGFLDRFRSAGLASEVTSFVGGKSATPLSANSVDTALGQGTIAGIAQRVGLKPNVASTALGFEIPKVIGLLTPGGKVPSELPSEFQSFLSSKGPVRPDAAIRGDERATMARPVGTAVPARRGGASWFWPVLGLIVLAAILYWALTPKRAPQPGVAGNAPGVMGTAQGGIAGTLSHTLNATVLNFAPGSAELPTASAPALQQAANLIKAVPAGTAIEIAAHANSAGNANANMTLSQQRADAVRNALVQDGVSSSMLTAKGYGDTMPVQGQSGDRIEFHASGGGTQP